MPHQHQPQPQSQSQSQSQGQGPHMQHPQHYQPQQAQSQSQSQAQPQPPQQQYPGTQHYNNSLGTSGSKPVNARGYTRNGEPIDDVHLGHQPVNSPFPDDAQGQQLNRVSSSQHRGQAAHGHPHAQLQSPSPSPSLSQSPSPSPSATNPTSTISATATISSTTNATVSAPSNHANSTNQPQSQTQPQPQPPSYPHPSQVNQPRPPQSQNQNQNQSQGQNQNNTISNSPIGPVGSNVSAQTSTSASASASTSSGQPQPPSGRAQTQASQASQATQSGQTTPGSRSTSQNVHPNYQEGYAGIPPHWSQLVFETPQSPEQYRARYDEMMKEITLQVKKSITYCEPSNQWQEQSFLLETVLIEHNDNPEALADAFEFHNKNKKCIITLAMLLRHTNHIQLFYPSSRNQVALYFFIRDHLGFYSARYQETFKHIHIRIAELTFLLRFLSYLHNASVLDQITLYNVRQAVFHLMEDIEPAMFASANNLRQYFSMLADDPYASIPSFDTMMPSRRTIFELADQYLSHYRNSLENRHLLKDIYHDHVQCLDENSLAQDTIALVKTATEDQRTFDGFRAVKSDAPFGFILRERTDDEIVREIAIPQIELKQPTRETAPLQDVAIPAFIDVSDRIDPGGRGSTTKLTDISFGSSWFDLDEKKHLLINMKFLDSSEAVPVERESFLRVSPDIIGRGKFATVYPAALDEVADSKPPLFAVKRVSISETMNVKTRDKCFNEVRILKMLNHPNIVRCYDAFYDKPSKSLILILELLDGGDLKVLVERVKGEGKKFSERQIWRFLRDLCSALSFMHTKRVMHRDLKPANVLLCHKGYVKVADFGLGRIVEGDDTLHAMSKVGTPLYMPPEVTRGEEYGTKAEVYGAGCLAWELIMLRPPLLACRGLSLVQLFDTIQKGNIPVLKPEICSYSPILCEAVMDMVSVTPSTRPPMDYIRVLASKQYERLTMLKRNKIVEVNFDAIKAEYNYYGRAAAIEALNEKNRDKSMKEASLDPEESLNGVSSKPKPADFDNPSISSSLPKPSDE